jgi:hypothetical protein
LEFVAVEYSAVEIGVSKAVVGVVRERLWRKDEKEEISAIPKIQCLKNE